VSRNPKHEDLAGHNGFGNPFSGAQWVHFVNFSVATPLMRRIAKF
jgi:hypothetical protein